MPDSRKLNAERVRDALITLGLDGDEIFRRIREDIDRGLIREARAHLNFVDRLIHEGKADA